VQKRDKKRALSSPGGQTAVFSLVYTSLSIWHIILREDVAAYMELESFFSYMYMLNVADFLQ
jgi:hypothetical protein